MIETVKAEPMAVVHEPTIVLRHRYWKRPTPLPPCSAVVSERILSVAQLPLGGAVEMTCRKILTTLRWRHPLRITRGAAQAGAQAGAQDSPIGTMIRPPLGIHMLTTLTLTTRMPMIPMLVALRLIVGIEGAGASPARARVLLVLAVEAAATIATTRARWKAIPMLTRRSSARIVLMMIRYSYFLRTRQFQST